ncbi:MAG TPA: hypothetical protein VMU95_08090 [Trebonia sp.]|nr:hypothetical protein [Trebonia sp.]
MRLSPVRAFTASAVALAMGAGVPTLLATSASAATPAGSAAPGAARAAAPASITSPVTGTFTNSDGTGTFAGTFTPTAFSVANGVLEATGLLKGTLTDANGTSLGSVAQTVTLPVDTTGAAAAPAACNVLNLVLGPLNLNLLGLVVTLNQVHLNITAVPGSLLGDLLCDVANLLNGGGTLSELSALLNEILSLL